MLIDSHCHLNYPEFSDLSATIVRAQEQGVRLMQTISTKESDFTVVRGLAERHPEIYCSIGIHPHEAEQHQHITDTSLREAATHPRVIGIGETGLDFYYEHSPRAIQEQLFRTHIRVARELDLPVIVHSRDADKDTVRILREEHEKHPFKFLIHCFSTTAYLAEESIKLGGYISLSGIITFKKSQGLRDIVAALPLERLLVETDAPYLAPEPYRGKPNEPAYTSYVAVKLGEIFGKTPEEIADVTSSNFFRLFTKAARPNA